MNDSSETKLGQWQKKLEPFVTFEDLEELEEMVSEKEEDLELMYSSLVEGEAKNAIRLKNANTRNIILLGRTRAGKSTVLQTMKNPFIFARECKLFSQTKDPKLYSFTMEWMSESDVPVNYNINVIDTPGLFEVRPGGEARRPDDEIKHLIAKCLEFEITRLHCLFFVCSFQGGVNSEDVAAINQLNAMFKGANKQFHLLVTRNEGKSGFRQKKLEADIRAIPELQEFFANGVQVFFIGALDFDDYDVPAIDAVKNKCLNLQGQRTKLYNHIFASSQFCHITDMEVFKQHHRDIDSMRDELQRATEAFVAFQGEAEQVDRMRKELKIKSEAFGTAVSKVARATGQSRVQLYNDSVNQAREAIEPGYIKRTEEQQASEQAACAEN
eukprot:TRINITY_DN315_c0_g1_i2.p1 TRINITY_DN315_c0_g1~~TRINITY_DN315_c0_g1_i2.p1  ORF type:complete len:384 (+),score=87.92 TRINITY_DN315_c0_g1_i2:217-1368(+)